MGELEDPRQLEKDGIEEQVETPSTLCTTLWEMYNINDPTSCPEVLGSHDMMMIIAVWLRSLCIERSTGSANDLTRCLLDPY